ncbi:MAG: polyprenol monophosphomannose synthase [Candidatus Omnitrophica bacterium]|nr:polyprenol monophosphomannose synthase [Candidatus Omnitrophota bacterium]
MKSLIIIPTYNERENIQSLIEDIWELKKGFHILIIDDNSPDGTGEILEKLRIKYQKSKIEVIHRRKKIGLGTAYIQGFRWALSRDFEYIFTMDADLSHNPKYLPLFLEKMADGYDVVVGSRYIKTGGREEKGVVNWPIYRLLLSRAANLYTRIITRLPLADSTGGFNCYRRKVLESIDLDRISSDGYAFQIEMKFKTWKKGFRLREIPIIFVGRRFGQSKISRKIIWKAIFLVWKLRTQRAQNR